MEEPKNTELPARIGEFEIRRLLGSGGSGEVYEASWGPRRVALKVLRSDLLPTDDERSRFYSEAQILSDLGHPGIVKILSYGSLDDGRPYLVMELLEGQPLADFVAAKKISFDNALHFFAQVAGAVTAIHDKGLIHRDLKPENVLVAGGRYAVLLDFGIAKSIDAPASTTTQEGGVRGTPAYMAPERFFGQPASVASDVYELAVLLYSMLTGALPWDSGLDPEARLNPLRPSQRGASLPPDLEAIIMRALSTRPEARQASVTELASAVSSATGQSSSTSSERTTAALQSGPQSGPHQSGTQARPHQSGAQVQPRPPAVTTAPPSMHIGTAPTTLAPALGNVTGQGGANTTQAAPRRRWPLWLGAGGGAIAVALAVVLALVPSGDEDILAGVEASRDGALNIVASAATAASERKVEPTPTREGDDTALATAARHHPSDTVVLMGLRVREIRQSKAFSKIFNQQKAKDPLLSIVRALEPCGIDVVDDLDWVTLGIAGGGRDDVDVIVSGAFTREVIEVCLEKVGQSLGAGSKVSREGDVTSTENTDGISSLVWLAPSTFMFTTRKDGDTAWLEARKRGDDPATEKGAIAAALKKTNSMASYWLVGRAEDLNVGEEYEGVPFPEVLEGTISVSDRLGVRASLDYPNLDVATKAHAALQEKFKLVTDDPLMSSLFEEVKTTLPDGETVVTVSFRIGSTGTALVANGIIEAIKQSAE